MKIIISGGSGTGKTETIAELSRHGYLTVGETIRQVLKQPKYKGFPNNGIKQIYDVQLELAKSQYRREQLFDTWDDLVFFDRSILDVYTFTKHLNVYNTFSKEHREMFNIHNYGKVFILEPLSKYQKDEVRWEDEKERNLLHKLCIGTYIEYGYQPIIVPEDTIEKRVNFILKKLGNENGNKSGIQEIS